DCALDETPHNRLEERETPPQHEARATIPAAARMPAPRPAAVPPPPFGPPVGLPAPPRVLPAEAITSPEQAAGDARLKAAKASSLEELRTIMEAFNGCALKASASRLVFADGNPEADVMLVGEAPGGEEDRLGKPFVGRSGMLLDRMLAAIGLNRTSAYITNIVPWRPPGNRTPTPAETAICKPFIVRHIELAAPKVLVTLGKPATQTLLEIDTGILTARGKWYTYTGGGASIRALATLHPAYLLRQPISKRLAWQDMRLLAAELERVK
ncbi:MAG: uracil-DNA glycosylase, partial [Methylobacteriaceae bacterium]|nr:uracil-DNA glycosylase [Methylobacteriaceae bacterium]